MKAGDVKRALANVPDETEVTVGADTIRLQPGVSSMARALMTASLLKRFAKADGDAFCQRTYGCDVEQLRSVLEPPQ
jgi:hypothetical protein